MWCTASSVGYQSPFLWGKVLREETQQFPVRQHSTLLVWDICLTFNLRDAVWSSFGCPEPSGSEGLDFIVVDIY